MSVSIRAPVGRRRRFGHAGVVLPGLGGALGVGVLAVEQPLAAVGAGTVGLLGTVIPWRELFGLLAITAMASRFRFNAGSVTLQAAHLLLVPFAIHVALFTRPETRLRWRWPEYLICFFIVLQAGTSLLHSPNKHASFSVVGLLGLGVLGYLTVYSTTWSRARLIFAARALLIAATIGAVAGLVAVAGHYAVGTTLGISHAPGITGYPPHGLSFEYNILGSLTASAAIALLVLMREPNPVFSHRFSMACFWLNFLCMLTTLTRGAWVAFACGFAAVALIRRRPVPKANRSARIALAAFALAVGVLGLLLLSSSGDVTTNNPIVSQGSQLLDFSSGTGAARSSEWQTALSQVKASPIIGLGTNSYGQRVPPPRSSRGRPAYIGNLYVRTLYDSGLVGLLMLALFLSAVLWPPRWWRFSAADLTPVSRAFVFGYATMAVAFAATDASFQPWPWIFLGVARAATLLAGRQHAALRSRPGDGKGELTPSRVLARA